MEFPMSCCCTWALINSCQSQFGFGAYLRPCSPPRLHVSGTSSSSSSSSSSSMVGRCRIFSIHLPPTPKPSHTKNSPRLLVLPNQKLNNSTEEEDDDENCGFREKMLYLESIGIDLFSLINDYPLIVSSSLDDMKSTVDYIRSMGFTALEFRRISGMCPEILNYRSSDIVKVFTFLLREANVMGSDLRKVIHRRPRLLVSDVENRLRPTLYFLQSIGISEINKYTWLLSCSVEEKFIPRIEYMESKMGFSHEDAISMIRRFPHLLCYSIKDNLEPKFDYLVAEMKRDLKELKDFPHYFSFSLENRIMLRHRYCVDKGVCFPLPLLLKTSEREFRDRLDQVSSSSSSSSSTSSQPLTTSPLWRCTNSYHHHTAIPTS